MVRWPPIRDLLRVGDLAAFGRFLALVAARNGCLLNLADLGRDVGVTAPTVASWLSTLEATGLLFLLRPYHQNFGKRLVKAPKLYLTDPALVTYLTGLHSVEAVLEGPSLGALFESVVVSEWIKKFHAAGEPPALYFWRSSAGEEVDLVLEREGSLFGFEVKATSTPTPHHAASLAKWLDLAGPRAQGTLVCRVPRPVPLRARIRAVPWTW